MLIITSAWILGLAAIFQGGNVEPDPGLPGDEGPLRSQAFVPLIPDSSLPKINETIPLMVDSAGIAFSQLRNVLREARQAGQGPLMPSLLMPANRDESAPRLYYDLTVMMRRAAVSLAGKPLELYNSDAGSAQAELAASITLPELVARATAYPRTESSSRALLLVFDLLLERGDLAGARAAVKRVIDSGAGTAIERAQWWKRERALASALGDGAPANISDAEIGRLAATGAVSPKDFINSKVTKPSPAIAAFAERWRFPVPPPEFKVNLTEPIERSAADMGDRIAIQTLGDLFILDAKTGAVRQRILDLSARATAAAPAPDASANEADKKLAFLGKRRARPSTDGRFLAATAGGSIWVYEKTDARVNLLWSRAAGKLTNTPSAEIKDQDSLFYCDGALAVGGRIFTASIHLAGDTSTFLDAFDAATGAQLYHRMIAKGSSATPKDERRFVGRIDAVAPQPLLYHGGVIIIATELGIVAAVDPLDGEIAWLLRLQRSAQPQGYEASAPAAAGSIVYLSPSDSDYLYALELDLAPPQAGMPGAAVPLPMAFDRAPQRRRDALFSRLAGAVDSRSLLYGREQQVRRTLTSFDFNPATRMLDNEPMGPGEQPVGLPLILGQNIFIPTNHGITLYVAERPVRDVWQLPLPVDPSTRLPLRGDEALGDLYKVEGGIVSCGKSWIICYDVKD
ncbi:MAG: PQQ-like beta-propeller repeat protein [Planctomycetes bacterium]|nr:PQQ-like beta-propeller repeat protein [Planctomycetota bacterium]